MNLTETPVERKRLTDQLVDRLLLLIVKNKLKEGDKLPTEQELTKQFDVGRSSLREAIGALTLTGVLSSRPGYGTFVNISQDLFLSKTLTWRVRMGQEKIEELVEARIALEQAVIRLAAAKADKKDIAEIKHNFQQFKSAIENRQKSAQLQADMGFHFALARASHNNTLYRFLSEFRRVMELWMKQTGRLENTGEASISHHQQILNAVESHDIEKAQKALRQHLEMAANNLSIVLLQKQFVSAV